MLKKRMFAILLAVAMVITMIPVMALAAEETPAITKVNMTLGSQLGINFMVDAKGSDMSGYSVRMTIGSDTAPQIISTYTKNGELYVYTAKLPVHRLYESLTIELYDGQKAVQTETEWTVKGYLEELVALNPDHAALEDLVNALLDYGTYADYYDDPTGTAPNSTAVEAVRGTALDAYKCSFVVGDLAGLNPVVSLRLDDAVDLKLKFDAAAWGEHKLLIDGEEVTPSTVGEQVIHEIGNLLPQNWGKLYHIQVVNADGETVLEFHYGALSYAYAALFMSPEAQTGLNGMLKAMYLYREAAVAYINCDDPIIEGDIIDEGDGPVIEF